MTMIRGMAKDELNHVEILLWPFGTDDLDLQISFRDHNVVI